MHRSSVVSIHLCLGMLLGLAVGFIFLVGLAAPARAQQGGPSTLPQGAAYRGQRIFAQHCVQCHGAQGRGDGPMASKSPKPPADLTDPAFGATRSPQAVFDVIANGRLDNLMPPFQESLSTAEIWDATAYIWSLHLNDTDLASAQMAYGSACASCHGADGKGQTSQPDAPALADARWLGQNETDWQAAVTAKPHPAVTGASAQDLVLASVFARSFSLGFNLLTPKIEGKGVLTVQVQNGTTGDKLMQTAVQLLIFDGQDMVAQRQAEANAEGVARFDNLPTDPTWAYVARTNYKDVPFESNMLQFEPSQASLAVPLSVYEGGAKQEDVQVSRAHWVIGLQDAQNLDVAEIYAFANKSDRVYMGESASVGKPVVLTFAVPKGAANVSFEGNETGDRFLPVDGSYVDTMPLPPGGRQVLLRYSLPIVDGAATLSHAISYPVDNLNLLAPDVGMTIETPNWTTQDPLQTPSGNYLNFVQTNLPAGALPQAIFSNINPAQFAAPDAASSSPQQTIDANATPGISGSPWLPVALIIVASALLGAGALFLIRRQQTQQAAQPVVRQQQKQVLIEEIADLDDAYETGEMGEADYQARRRLLKAQLVTLVRDQAG